MKPLPAEGSQTNRATGRSHSVLPTPGGSRSGSNRRITTTRRSTYPALLVASTLTSALFCYLYITKPVLMPAPSGTLLPSPAIVSKEASTSPSAPTSVEKAPASPSGSHLPGDPPSRAVTNTIPVAVNSFEETNFKVQHVVTAEAPDGITKRLDFKVPVLYRSRSLRWDRQDVAEARELLSRLAAHRDKTRELRTEAIALEDAWNALLEHSMPLQSLQADSPSLIDNQGRSNENGATPSTEPRESIHIQPAAK